MKSITFLTKHLGENADTTKTMIEVWNEEKHRSLMEEKKLCCVNSGFDMLIEVRLYGKVTVEMPDWMPVKEYLNDYGISMRWFVGMGGDLSWPESWYRKITSLDEKERFAVIKLVKQKSFRVEKRKQLQERFIAWLNDSGELLRYDLSNVRNKYLDMECAAISNHLYWSR